MENLPEDVLLNIMSKLGLRDVVKFSTVSKKWPYLPYCLSRITIDVSISNGVCTENKDSFINWVNRFLEHYVKFRRNSVLPVSLGRFDIFFCFTRLNFTDVDRWIRMSIQNGVRSLTVRPTCRLHHRICLHDDDKYIFPWEELQNSPVVLERIALRGCIFGCTLTSRWISLQILQLYHSNLTEYDMDKIWFCFPNLGKLVLLGCIVPAKLTFRSRALTSLRVWYCPGLNEIDLVDAKSMKEFNYRGNRIDLSLFSSPKVTKLRLGFVDAKGGVYSFQKLHGDTIKFVSTYVESEPLPMHSPLHGQASSLSQLTELILDRHPTCSICRKTLIDILKACPLLSRLLMVPPCIIDDAENDTERDCIQYHHKCLKFIKIMGFCGSRANLEVTKFIIQVPEELCYLVVDSTIEEKEFKYVKYCAAWHGEQEPKAVKEILLGLVKNAQLTFTCSESTAQVVAMNKYQLLFGFVNKFQQLLKTFCLWAD